MTESPVHAISNEAHRQGARRIAKNATSLFAAHIFDSVVALVATGLVARHLGKELFGVYIFARVVAGVLRTVINCGVDTIATREMTRRPDQAPQYFTAAFLLTLSLAVLASGFIILFINMVGWSFAMKHALYAALFAVTTQVLASVVSAAFQAFERMELDALKLVLNQSVYLILVAAGVAALPKQTGVVWFILAIGIANMCDILFGVTLLRLKFFSPWWHADISLYKFLLHEGAPLGARRFLRNTGLKIDTFVINFMKSKSDVGLFGSVYQILSQLRLLPNVTNTALFPGFARKWVHEPSALLPACERALRFMLTLALPLSVGIMMLSGQLVKLILGKDFLAAQTPLAVLCWGLMLMFLSSVLLTVLNAVDKQHLGTIACIVTLGVNFVFDLLLIPAWSYNGAAVASVIAEVTLFGLCYHYVCRIVGPLKLAALAWKPLLSASLMGAVMWMFSGKPMLIVALAGALVYGLSIFALRTFNDEELKLLKAAFRRCNV